MRKLILVTALVLMMVPLVAAAAYAGNQIIQCAGIPCTSTGSSDLVKERIGNRLNDKIYLKGGSDQVRRYLQGRPRPHLRRQGLRPDLHE